MPHWVKISGIIIAALLVLVVVVVVTGIGGTHGPGRHISGNADPSSQGTRVSSATSQPVEFR